MVKDSPSPLDWITQAMSSTVTAILLYLICVSLGVGAASEGGFDAGWILTAPWFLICSVGEPVGLLSFPLQVYIIYSLIFERHNPFLLFALTIFISALTAIFREDYGFEPSLWLVVVLTPVLYILFTAWYIPVKAFVRRLTRLKYKGIRFDE